MELFNSRAKASLPISAIDTARKFLRYALVDVNFTYWNLTDTERALCTEEEFNRMVQFFKIS